MVSVMSMQEQVIYPEIMEDLKRLSAGEQSQDSSLLDSRPCALNYLLFWEADSANMCFPKYCTAPYQRGTQLIPTAKECDFLW